MRFAFASLCFVLLLPAFASAECLHDGKSAALTGVVKEEIFPGRPNYESVEKGDTPVRAWILSADTPYCVVGYSVEDGTPFDMGAPTRFHLIFTPKSKESGALLKHGGRFEIQGAVFQGTNAHHKTKALIDVTSVKAISPPITEAEQSNIYFKCLLRRGANPPDIPKADFEYCLLEAGIQDPGEALRGEKGQAWRNCLVSQAVRLDDNISPAPDVARAIVQLCSNEWRNYVNSLWMLPDGKRMMIGEIDKYAVREGVQAVLLTRKTLRDMKAKTK